MLGVVKGTKKSKIEKLKNILIQNWNDYNLKWNASDYGDITSIRVESKKIWVPDLLLYNSADDSFSVGSTVNAVIYYDGTVKFLNIFINLKNILNCLFNLKYLIF